MLDSEKEVRLNWTGVSEFLLKSALTVSILLFSGCHGTGTPSNSTEQPARAAALGTSEASSPGEQASPPRLTIPDDFPAAVPLLPRRQIRSISPRGDGSLSLTYSASKNRHETAVFYREQLAILGWIVTLDRLSGGMTTLSARQEEGRRLTVNIIENPAEQLTMIGLYHRPPQEESGS